MPTRHGPVPLTGPTSSPRVAVIVPCFNDGALLAEALASLREDEPLEIVVVDDASTEPTTLAMLDGLRAGGTRVIRHEVNRHLVAARLTGLSATSARYVYPLDADDQAVAGVLTTMADRLDAVPGAAVVAGDYEEFGSRELLRAVPETLDPFRVAFCNEYPVTALFRRTALQQRAWRPGLRGYEDWDLWMSLAEAGRRMEHLGPGRPTFRKRLHGSRMLADVRRGHVALYEDLRAAHPRLFAELPGHLRASPMPWRRKLLYPIVYGGRRGTRAELVVKAWLDERQLWTLRR